jgi:hypothetical protein
MRAFGAVLIAFAGCAALVAQGPPPMGPRPDFGRGRGFGMAMGPGSGKVITGHPYSGTETLSTVQTLAGGNTITHQSVKQVYRDSEGRTRVERTITPPPGSSQSSFTEAVITDPVSGYRYVVNTTAGTYRQIQLPPARTSSTTNTRPTPPQRPGFTMSTKDLGTMTVNGVPATGKETDEIIAAGTIGNANPITITRVVWTSTDLQVPVSIKSSDPRFATSDFELTNISTSEPAASLFSVAGLTLVQGRGPGGFGRGPGGGGGAFRRPPQPQQ